MRETDIYVGQIDKTNIMTIDERVKDYNKTTIQPIYFGWFQLSLENNSTINRN